MHDAQQVRLKGCVVVQARRRALANVHFMGQLYHRQLLSERVMHTCLKQLLTDMKAPEPANLECLVALMTAVGQQLEANPAAVGYMTQYFDRIAYLSNDMRLENHICRMLQASLQVLWQAVPSLLVCCVDNRCPPVFRQQL